jgi:SNF2 family DNA or RNA helicase
VEETLWKFSKTHNSACKVIDEHKLWDRAYCHIWLPEKDTVVRVPLADLRPISFDQKNDVEVQKVAYIIAASKIADLLESVTNKSEDQVLLAPMDSSVIPLPHQIHALSRALSSDRVRYLLADEVGLGKTIEAGLVMRELKLRGIVRRTLVVTPKSLAMQWVAEMDTHFNEKFSLVNPSDLEALERLEYSGSYNDYEKTLELGSNPWLKFPQAIVTLDSVKPMSRRKGWSREKIQRYNRNRFERLILGNWDLIIVDESHKMGGSTDQVARFKLGQGLSEAAPHLLLLSATPHQGKSDAFQRLMSIIDPMVFPDLESITKSRVSKFVIRTEKRNTVTEEGKPLFRPRITQTLDIDLDQNPAQVILYESVTAYVKDGYNRAVKDRKPHVGFLMVLLQRIVTSSSHAIHKTLERRLNVLENLQNSSVKLNEDDLEDFVDLDGQMQLDMIIKIDELARTSEMAEVKGLLELAKEAERSGPDVKTQALMNLIFQLQGEENDDQLKILLFTEFVSTQEMLKVFLEERGISCSILNGSLSMDQRRLVQRDFRDKSRVLISTDAGGEGLNLQFCHIVINYDLPWNPMRIEQRIGRVDRIGQDKVVKAYNFLYKNSVEARVREVLEIKLAIILDEMGIDKTSDILDTSMSGNLIEGMMTHVVVGGADLNIEIEKNVKNLHKEMKQIRKESLVYEISENPNLIDTDKIRNHPLPYWLERMTINYLQSEGCKIKNGIFGWDFDWPDGEKVQNVVFSSKDITSDNVLLSLENSLINKIITNLPQIFPGQLVPQVFVEGLPKSVTGLWGLFEVNISIEESGFSQIRMPLIRKRYVPVFIGENGKIFTPTAIYIWNHLLINDVILKTFNTTKDSGIIYKEINKAGEIAGRTYFEELRKTHIKSVINEEGRGKIAFLSRRKAIDRLGLPEVRKFRLARLAIEESEWEKELQAVRNIMPDLRPLVIMKIISGVGE